MARRIHKLTAASVASKREPGKYGDGNGLLYRVYPSGARCWEQRISVNGRRRTYGLGGYPVVSLAQARERALENLRLLRSGGDPGAARRKSGEPTLAEAAEVVCRQLSVKWTNPREALNWMASLEHHVLPRLGALRVSAIEPSDMLAVLIPLWTDKFPTAQRVRQRLSVIMRWAMAHGYRTDNPAGEAISGGLPVGEKRTKNHYPAVAHGEVGRVVGLVRLWTGSLSMPLAFEFLVLTAARSREVRCAVWSEVNFDEGVWTVPAERMKARQEHTVALSSRAIAVLEQARELGHGLDSDVIFPNRGGRFFGESSLGNLMRSLKIQAVPHGFRSSFRDWCADTGVDRELAEACLAHAVGNQVEQAYRRSAMLDRRRPVMESWAEYVEQGAGRAKSEGLGGSARDVVAGGGVRRRRRRVRKRAESEGPGVQSELFA